MQHDDMVLISLNDLGNAFCEWDRRFHEERDRFESEIDALLHKSSDNYGIVCVLYLLKLVQEISPRKEPIQQFRQNVDSINRNN